LPKTDKSKTANNPSIAHRPPPKQILKCSSRLDESYASSKAFAALFKTRMFEILNEGQRKRLQELTDNPPLHALALIQRLRREQWGLE
jgi:hypothetical protein